MTGIEAPDYRICAVCGRTLDVFAEYEGSTLVSQRWMHGPQDQPEDHPAVPVTVAETAHVGRCDFCNVDYPSWELPARDFESPMGPMSAGAWSACDTCATYLRRGHWSGLIRHLSTIVAPRNGLTPTQFRAVITPYYNRLRKNVTGPVRRPTR